MRTALCFDDVLLLPKQGVLDSRKDADISSELVAGFKLDVPIISANMPSVTEHHMAAAMYRAGGFGILHRFAEPEYLIEEYLYTTGIPSLDCGVSFGLKDASLIKGYYELGCRIFCLDVAHGDSKQVITAINTFKLLFPEGKLIVGNIARGVAAYDLANAGADAVKVGIGPGAACRTREVTGFGVPQLTAILDVAETIKWFNNQRGTNVKVIADGGIKNSGDIVKALAAGADTVMIGSLLAGCDEAPNPGEYYGNAAHKVNGHRAPEGSYGKVKRTGSVEDVIKELAWGIKSGISYGGARNIKELQENAEFIQITSNGIQENKARI